MGNDNNSYNNNYLIFQWSVYNKEYLLYKDNSSVRNIWKNTDIVGSVLVCAYPSVGEYMALGVNTGENIGKKKKKKSHSSAWLHSALTLLINTYSFSVTHDSSLLYTGDAAFFLTH